MKRFKELNKNVEIREFENKIILNNLWNEKSFECAIDKKNEKTIENLYFPNNLSAFYHYDTKCLEFIFTPLKESYAFLKTKFSFMFKGKKFECFFDKATQAVELFSIGLKILDDSETNFRNLLRFKYYFSDRDEIKIQYTPYSFFVKGDFDSISDKFFIILSKHINFYTHYFNKNFPFIQIHDEKIENTKYEIKNPNIIGNIPNTITARNLNQTILDIVLLATETQNIRLKYIFYYQILEYYSYYYLENDKKKNLINILRNPDIVDNVDEYSNKIIEILKDSYIYSKDDVGILQKLIRDNCCCEDIEKEIKINENYFLQTIDFEGGFQLKNIFKDKNSVHIDFSVLNTIVQNLNKIRNVLVHLRESRENKVILPTRKNRELIKPYLYILQKIVEKIIVSVDIGNIN